MELIKWEATIMGSELGIKIAASSYFDHNIGVYFKQNWMASITIRGRKLAGRQD